MPKWLARFFRIKTVQSIPCARCGEEIHPGDAVASYRMEKAAAQEGAFRTPKGSYLGCMRMSCCPSGGFFSGHWLGHNRGGFSPMYDGGSAVSEAFRTGKVIVMNFK
jgi:hypothetical protein